jgi:hypothetical protein
MPALMILKLRDLKFKASLDYIIKSCFKNKGGREKCT